MTSLPDWLVERAALDEIPPASRARVAGDATGLATRVAALHADNAAELAHHPAAPAVALIDARVAEARRVARRRRARRFGTLGLATSVAAVALVVTHGGATRSGEPATDLEITRAKGVARLVVFRQVGERAERVESEALVREGDVLQLRYDAGGQRYGVIASVDGAGVVTLHFPAREDAPPEATAVAARLTTLPQAYALDGAPRFERFFFITADAPIDLSASLGALRALASRDDRADANLDLPPGLHQWSLRVRKP